MQTLLLTILLAVSPQTALDELHAMCARDGGRLWGVALCGPTMIVDRQTRAIVADRPAPATLPKTVGISNTSLDFNGEHWTMIMGPLPDDPFARRSLLAHESFHRIQKSLGFPSTGPANTHLDTVEGRYWLQLEWRAVVKALSGDRNALRDALAFRAMRRSLYPTAANEERELEMHEGLAEYTGVAMAEPDVAKRVPQLIAKLQDAEALPTFVRSFAYASGPAWGTLLEMRSRGWTRHARAADDLAGLAAAAWRVKPAADAKDAAKRYGSAALLAAERERDAKKQATLRDLRGRFIDGPHLTLPLEHMSFEFDPNASQPLGEHGTVYPTLTARDDWGALVVTRGGALISSDWKRIVVPAPPSDDYQLTLKEGWTIAGDRVQRK